MNPEPQREAAGTADAKPTKIGIIFVHGIGEQRRFSHLDGEVRPLIDAIVRRKSATAPRTQTTVEITVGTASTLMADQDTWSTEKGAPVRAIVKEGGVEKELHFHEVWWADVNEPYSLWKQIRFWGWGLAVWVLRKRTTIRHPEIMASPSFKGWWKKGGVPMARLQLYFISNFFLMGAFSVGTLSFLAKRLLNFEPPKFIRVFVNYVSAVKLYNQPTRSDGGFLDAFREPPRVSIRRRMIRTIVDVAMQKDYDRWYVFAHSLGSIVAFNGLMENAHALPNYLDEARWLKLKEPACGLGGRAAGHPCERLPGNLYRADSTQDMLPLRPLWLHKDDVVYRDELLKKFRGLVTYGSPLDKFARIWPEQVPINTKEPVFSPTAEWINVFDPTDPVGASLEAFDADDRGNPLGNGVLTPKNYGYCAGPVFLVSHLKYLAVRTRAPLRKDPSYRNDLSDALAEWVLGGKTFAPIQSPTRWPWFTPNGGIHWTRWFLRQLWQWGGYVVLAVLGALTLPWLGGIIADMAQKVYNWPIVQQLAGELSPFVTPAMERGAGYVSGAILWIVGLLNTIILGVTGFIGYVLGEVLGFVLPGLVAFLRERVFTMEVRLLIGWVAIAILIAGALGKLFQFDKPAPVPAAGEERFRERPA